MYVKLLPCLCKSRYAHDVYVPRRCLWGIAHMEPFSCLGDIVHVEQNPFSNGKDAHSLVILQ
jgi:hypothetical protein